MKFNYGKAIVTFIIGFILSMAIGIAFNDGELATMTAVCYVGAIVVGTFTK